MWLDPCRTTAAGPNAFSTLPRHFLLHRPPRAPAKARLADDGLQTMKVSPFRVATSFGASAATLAFARRAGNRPGEPVLRLGPRSGDRDSSRISCEPWRTRICTGRDRRSLRRAFQLREIGWWLDRGSPKAAQAHRHRRIFRHRTFHIRVRLRAYLAGDTADARSRLGRARQPRPIARHAAGRLRRARTARPRIWIRTCDGYDRRGARPIVRDGVARNARRARSLALDAASRPRCRSGVRVSRAQRNSGRRPPCAELCLQLCAASKNVLALPRRSFRARHRRFCAHATDPARGSNSDAALWLCARFGHRSSALHFLQFRGCRSIVSGRSARRSHRQTRSAGCRLSFRGRGIRGVYFRATYHSDARDFSLAWLEFTAQCSNPWKNRSQRSCCLPPIAARASASLPR